MTAASKRVAGARQIVNDARYVLVPRIRPWIFNEAARSSEALTFLEWQDHPDRPSCEMFEDDRAALAQIICFVSRPARPDLSLKHLRAYSNLRVKDATGMPHPAFASAPRKKRAEVTSPFNTLDRLFRRGLQAGRALEHAWSDCLKPDEFGAALTRSSGDVFQIDYLPPESDERKKLWSDYIGAVHLCMAVRTTLIELGYDPDERRTPAGDLTASLLDEANSSDWVGRCLVQAEEWAYRVYFQELLPRPERMIRFIMRERDLDL